MSEACEAWRLLLQAELDGELSAAEAAQLEAHRRDCAGCSAERAALLALRERLREVELERAPDALHRRLRPARRWAWREAGLGAAAGAMAACLTLLAVPRQEPGVADALASAHARALLPGHLLDVASSDHHTVRPWFAGRLAFAPPVRELAAAGFPLLGGRLDVVAGRPAAVLAYGGGRHVVELYVWAAGSTQGAAAGDAAGYAFRRWTEAGLAFWAISDASASELARFEAAWRRAA